MIVINLLHAAILENDLNRCVLFYHSDAERAGRDYEEKRRMMIISAVITQVIEYIKWVTFSRK